MSTQPVRLDLTVFDNETFAMPGGWGLFEENPADPADLYGLPMDLSGCRLDMQVRRAPNAGPALLSWSAFGDASGVFTPTFDAGAIHGLAGDQVERRYAYDFTLTQGAVTSVLLTGAFIIKPGVTRQ